jgi:hypothetical protein
MKSFNLARLGRLAARAAMGYRSLESQAHRRWTICDGETTRVPPALYPQGSLDRITAFSPWVRPENEMRSLRGDRIEHAATLAFEVHGVEIVDGLLYKGPCEHRSGYGEARWFLGAGARRESLDRAWVVSTNGGCHYFGIWARADLPTEELPPGDERRLVMPNVGFAHEPGYRRLLASPGATAVQWARVGALMFLRDFGENRSKEARYRALRQRLRERVVSSRPSFGVYLKRGATGERRVIANEAALDAFLGSRGFKVVEPAVLSPEQIAAQMLDARLVISCEGSHLAHSIYTMADDATLLVLQPPERFSLAFKAFTDRLGMRFAFVVGRPSQEGFEVDLDELAGFIDRIACRRASS